MSEGKRSLPFLEGDKRMKKIILILISALFVSAVPANAMVNKETRLWQDESIYSIMIDRFNDADTRNNFNVQAEDPLAYNGGDFQGIINKLDYIHDMGFTAIKLSPIFDNADNGYHGYWVNNFYKVDEHFGAMKTFQKLVKEAHKRKMKVLIDFVANNTAKTHPWVNDAIKKDWFHQNNGTIDWNNPLQAENGWVNGLPDLNQDNPEVRDYLINAAKWWVQKTNIDGYTLPEVDLVPVSFWSEFAASVKQVKRNFFLMGIPSGTAAIIQKPYLEAGINSIYDYEKSKTMRTVFANTDHSFGSIDAATAQGVNKETNPSFFDSEYTTRFTKDIVSERQYPGSRWETALTYLYTTPGIPVVFYGTEIAMNSGNVPDNRQLMNFRANKDLIDYITKIGELRKKLPSLTRGTMKMLYDHNGMAVYKRTYRGETSVIAINNTRKSQKVTLTSKDLTEGQELRGLLAGDLVRSQDGKYILVMNRDNSEIYVQAEKSGINIKLLAPTVVTVILMIIFLYFIIKRRNRDIVE